jgi:hypothetical protein
MSDVNVSIVAMVDRSASMLSAMQFVEDDGKAFVRAARPGDEIAVVEFRDTAKVLYPDAPEFATVDGQLASTAEAATRLVGGTGAGQTNLYQAMSIAQGLIPHASHSTRAIVMFTDGVWNTGGDPTPLVGPSPPLFVCGIGPFAAPSNVAEMLKKNSQSRYLEWPSSWDMIGLFNSIRDLAAGPSQRVVLDVPQALSVGEPLVANIRLIDDGAIVSDAEVDLRLHAPRHDVAALLGHHADAIDALLAAHPVDEAAVDGPPSARAGRLLALREVLAAAGDGDPFEQITQPVALVEEEDGSYVADLGPVPHAGTYTLTAIAHHRSVQRTALATIVVG